MPFVQKKLDRIFNQTRGIFDKFAYQPKNGDTIDDILADGYFEQSRFAGDPDWPGSIIEIVATGGSRVFEITPDGRSAQDIGADETGFADDMDGGGHKTERGAEKQRNAVNMNERGVKPRKRMKVK